MFVCSKVDIGVGVFMIWMSYLCMGSKVVFKIILMVM